MRRIQLISTSINNYLFYLTFLFFLGLLEIIFLIIFIFLLLYLRLTMNSCMVVDNGVNRLTVDKEEFCSQDWPFPNIKYLSVLNGFSFVLLNLHLFVYSSITPSYNIYFIVLFPLKSESGVSSEYFQLEILDEILKPFLFPLDLYPSVIEVEYFSKNLISKPILSKPLEVIRSFQWPNWQHTFWFNSQLKPLRLIVFHIFEVN